MILDATALLLLLNDQTPAPKHPETQEEITDAHERVKALVEQITAAGQKVVIAAPVLAELMVRAENAESEYMKEFSNSSRFRLAPFDHKAAIEHAMYTREALKTGDKRGGINDDWGKVKFDRQIIAIARSLAINKICTDDENLEKHAKKQNIDVVHIYDIQLLQQDNLFPEPEAEAQPEQQPIAESLRQAEQKPEPIQPTQTNEKGGAVVETAPPSPR